MEERKKKVSREKKTEERQMNEMEGREKGEESEK